MRTTTQLTVPISVFCLAAAFVLLGGATSTVSHFSHRFESRALPFQPPHVRVSEAYGKLPLHFEANQGQTDSGVKFLSRGRGYTLFLTGRGEAVMLLGKPAPMYDRLESAALLRAAAKPSPKPATPAAVVRMNLIGASTSPRVEGVEESPGKANYFIGNDPKMWRTNVPMYAKVKVHGLYPGVDLVYYGNQRKLEYDFIVAPGADPGSITMAVEGAERPSLDGQGDLVLAIEDKEVRFQKPVVYQEVDGVRQEISGSYKLKSAHQVGFQVGAYDGSRPLIIDPTLSYSTYLGGSGLDQSLGIAVDSSGHAYVTGFTTSTNFPTTPGAFQTTAPGGVVDAFVAKLNAAGSALLYCTYLGGSGVDQGLGVAVDSGGHAYVTGFTNSMNFPTTLVAFRTTSGGGAHAFVTKLNPTGSGLVYSTYLGGSSNDRGLGIAVDSGGHAYVTGRTNSMNFPTTPGAFQTTSSGGFDAFVTRLNPTGSGLVYSTYLGGSGTDQGRGIAVDPGGHAHVTGLTNSTNFPTTPGTFQTTSGGGVHAFVTKLNPTGSGLVYSTYLGGSGSDQGQGIAVGSGGHAYVTGSTSSTNFPTTTNAIQPASGGGEDAFVTMLNSTGTGLVYSTYLGGSGDEEGKGIAVDSRGHAYVTGFTSSINFPRTTGAFQAIAPVKVPLGGHGAFVAALNPLGTGLVYSSYLGGSGEDVGFGIALDGSYSAYFTGLTNSINFPTTAGAYQTTDPVPIMGSGEAFVTKIANMTCSPQGDDVEGDGGEQGADGHEGYFHFCKSSGEMEFEERDSGKRMKGRMDAVTISGNQALINGRGTLLDGTPLYYAAVVLGNAPVIGANHFAIVWITSTGSFFHTFGPLTNGYIAVHGSSTQTGGLLDQVEQLR